MVCDSAVVNFSTLGDMLLRQYITDFMANMQSVGSIWAKINPQNAVFHSTSNDLEHIAKVTFRENKMDKWAVWSMPEEMKKDWPWDSVLGHQCRRFGPVAFMSLHNNAEEVCYKCNDPMPEKLVGLWKLQNYDNYTGVLK